MAETADNGSPAVIETSAGRRIAYSRVQAAATGASRPGVAFLGGFRSDMTGGKAVALENWARAEGRACLRFDYSGHGQSGGAFEDGAIGDWAEDAFEVVTRLTEGPQILVGSSMGGWIMLLLAKRLTASAAAARLAGLVGVAAAPDFTEDLMWSGFSDAQRAAIAQDGRIDLPSDYDEIPTPITRRLIEDGRANLVLRDPLQIPCPVRLLHGSADPDVPLSVGLQLLAHMTAPDARLTVVKDAGHRFSEPSEIDLLLRTVEEIA